LGVFASTAYAQPAKIPQESGFSGFVSGGAGLWRVEDNMVKKIGGFKVSDDDINSIDDKPRSETSVTPVFNYNLSPVPVRKSFLVVSWKISFAWIRPPFWE
jgi:hypothetical protein